MTDDRHNDDALDLASLELGEIDLVEADLDAETIETEQWIERYVLDQLSDPQARRFEAYAAMHPEMLDQIDAARDLHQGLKRVAGEEIGRVGMIAGLAWIWRRAGLAASALLLVALLPALLLFTENRRLNEALATDLASPPTVVLDVMRDAAATQRIRVDNDWLTLAVEVDDAVQRVDVVLSRGSGEQVWSQNAIEPNPWGVVQVMARADSLPPGDYVLSVTEGTTELGPFLFVIDP